jgi:poly(rC)-binding protein 2/3/4
VVFRLLCHASRIGAFIGKGGYVIKSLQQLTDSKIRIDDAPVDCAERVIAVIVKLDGEVDGDFTKPQEALLKVFERILDVAAESEGTSDFGDRVVSCRLLVNAGQAGSVIGKGGKVVEKIRIDTGCRIRVLNDKLPACTKPSDEIIEVNFCFLLVFYLIAQINVCLFFFVSMLLNNAFDYFCVRVCLVKL